MTVEESWALLRKNSTFFKNTSAIIGSFMSLWLVSEEVIAQNPSANRRQVAQDTSRDNRQGRRLLYSRWDDRIGNRFNYVPPRSSLYLREPKGLSNDFRLDTTQRMSVYERIGDPKRHHSTIEIR
ncbi:MAG: hypothetical protein R2822_05995 [Spirosomataceae bacterium]